MTLADALGGVPVVVGIALLSGFVIWSFVLIYGAFEDEEERKGWFMAGFFAAISTSAAYLWYLFGG